MISLRVFAIVAIVGVLLLGLSACGPPNLSGLEGGCLADTDCVKGLHCCDDKCHECCADRDCDEGEKCDNYECVQIEVPPPASEPESEEEPPAPAPEPEPECTQDSDCCESHQGQAYYCNDDGKCVALGCKTPADCKKVCPTGNWECRSGLCLEPDECAGNADCCDLHPGEVWECDEDDGKCYKVGCETASDCEEICPTGQWECDESFGDCVKAAPAPNPECTDDAVVTFVISGEPGQEFWAARWPEQGPPPTWREMKQRFCEDPAAMGDLHTWNLIAATADGDGKATITIPGNSWWTILGRTLGDERSPSGICAIRASDWYEVTEQLQCLGTQIDVPGVQPVFECIEGCSELH